MAQISAGTIVLAKWATIPAALIVGGIVVSQASYSAFSAETTDGVTNWKAGNVALTNTAPAAATFEAANLAPLDTGSKCITVTSNGSLSSTVKLYARDLGTTASATDLSPYIDLNIETAATCESLNFTKISPVGLTLKTLGDHTSWQNGIGTNWTTGAAGDSRAFKISYTLKGSTPNTHQNGDAKISFIWEAQTAQNP